jgi:regulator of sigma E protease
LIETFLIAIGTFVPMLIILVVVHELGHFFTAKAFGVKVLEFGIGYPPKAFGFYTGRTTVLIDQETQYVNLTGPEALSPGKIIRVSSSEDRRGNLVARVIESPQLGSKPKGPQSLQELGRDEYLNHEGKVREASSNSIVLADMVYSLNWTPLGGFVKLAGESNPAVPRSLASKGVGPRAIVLAAGSFMNALLPLVLFTVLFMFPHDVPVGDTGDVTVISVAAGSAAEAAGVLPGDIIVQANALRMTRASDLSEVVQQSEGSPVELLVARGDGREIVTVTPQFDAPGNRWLAGINMQLANVAVERRSEAPWTAVGLAFTNTWDMLVLLKQEIFGWLTGNGAPELSGPIGIAQITGEVTQQMGIQGWLLLTILFSINLAILNILPIPMLDGGRLLFVAIEWVRRGKRVSPEREGLVHLIGFIVLISLIVLISANDISRLIQGGSLLGG